MHAGKLVHGLGSKTVAETLYYVRANFRLMYDFLSRVLWEAVDVYGAAEFFQNVVNKMISQTVLLKKNETNTRYPK